MPMILGEFELIEPVPELRNTRAIAMLRPWVDVGKVGTLVLTKLERHLGAKELGRLKKPGNYFDFTRYRPRTRIVDGQRVFTRPNTIVHHAHDDQTDRDYLFLHMREPHAMGEDYTDAIVALLKEFNVTEYCRVGGMYDRVPHTRPILITGTLSEQQARQAGNLVSPRRSTYQGPTSIVNLVTDAMTESDVQATMLMAHLPQYVQLDEDHMGAARLMEVLCAVYGFPQSMADSRLGQQQYRDISRAVEHNGEVRTLIDQLENYYDGTLAARTSVEQEEEGTTLAPDVERFLRQVGERLGDNMEDQDGDEEDDE